MSQSPTEEAYKDAVECFVNSSLWLVHPGLQHWFDKKWQPQYKVCALLYVSYLAQYIYIFNRISVALAHVANSTRRVQHGVFGACIQHHLDVLHTVLQPSLVASSRRASRHDDPRYWLNCSWTHLSLHVSSTQCCETTIHNESGNIDVQLNTGCEYVNAWNRLIMKALPMFVHS